MAVAFGEFVFDAQTRELSRSGVRLKVDAKLLQLLGYFLEHPGRVISKRELLEQVWDGRAVADNLLSVSVAKLRKVLGHQAGHEEYIENSYGRGYRFVRPLSVVAPSADASRADRSRKAALPPPLVGRAQELERLRAALARAHEGRGSICLLMGEPGIGKTRLAEALAGEVRAAGGVVAWGRCQPSDGAPPLWPFIQMLRELEGSELAEDILRVAHGVQGHGEEPASSGTMLSQLTLYDAVRTSHRTIDAITQALQRLAKQQPRLLLLDDLQWADAATVRLLVHLVGEIKRWPVLLVATYRGVELADHASDRGLLRLFAHADCERIVLERLSREQISEYLGSLFDGDVSQLCRAVHLRSEGNPFFMVELLRPVLGTTQPSADALQVSGAARELVRERLTRLPDVAREALSAAAVIGHDFDLGLLSHVTELPAHELLEALDSSLANDTVVPSDDLSGAYAFDHALIREVLYADTPARKRCLWHMRAGQALLKRRASGGEVSSAELAHHFLSGLPHGDVTVAVGYAREAAAAATWLGAHADARMLLRRALAALRFALEPDPALRTALLLELGLAERVLGEPNYHHQLRQGVELARSLRLGSMLALAGRFLSPGPGFLISAHAGPTLQAALEVLPESDHAQRALVLTHLAWTPPYSNSARKVRELLDQAQAHALRSNDVEAKRVLRNAELFCNSGPATYAKAEAIAREIDRDLAASPHVFVQWGATATRVFRVITAYQRGNLAEAQRVIDELGELHKTLNNTELFWHHGRLQLAHRMNRGDWNGVERELERLAERAKRFRFESWRNIFAVDYSTFLLNTGDPRPFAALARQGLAPVPHDVPNARSIKLRMLAEHGFLQEARAALLEYTPEVLRDLPQDRDYLAVLSDLAICAKLTGTHEVAGVLFELLEPYSEYFAMGMSFHLQGSIAQFLGNLAHMLGRHEQALEYLAQGVSATRRVGANTSLVHNLLDLAMLLLEPSAVQDLRRARALLGEVAELAGALAMQPAQSAALQLLAEGPRARGVRELAEQRAEPGLEP